MINYKIIEENSEFQVYESQTNQLICSSPNRTLAKEKVKHFNLGGGFDGWTPSFILIKLYK